MTHRANIHYDPSAGFAGGGAGRRFAHLRGYVGRRIWFSPAAAFALAICGVYAFAGLVNKFDPEGSTGSILVRLVIVLITLGSYVLLPAKLKSSTAALIPMKLFFVLYTCRLVENIYISSISISPGPMMVFSVFLVTGVGAALLIASMDRAIRNTDLIFVMNALCVIFLFGLYLNSDVLFVSQGERMTLDKINPIAMGHTAFAFLIYFFLVLGKTKKLTIQSAILGPMLLLVVVFSRSRGAYIAGAGALLVYILLLKGSKRVFAVLGALVVAMAILASSGVELIDVVIARLQTINVDADQSTMIRSQLFAGAWSQFLESPVFGRYAVEMRFNFYPHNIYLESLMAVGALGSLPFAAHIALALRSTVGIIRSGKFPLAAVLAAVLFIREAIAGLASGSLWGNSLFWVTSALTISFWYGYQGFLAKNRTPEIKAY
ncbi:O-antigen ligase family protein [Mesorhizobium sp.]|uniref:O-antigen ligase family protein n=1 Tax=Mesorhizobium sp. TaxID=1871066 RepID=UPI000FE535D0|nr:O-antigen ligase family protein [Mesorhizobium sp.]RWC46539.1 MAG: O-antigen ligase domain-containing protein [Mesorhizobium sp.]RWE85929.1 MAG: O-antigen ligase domain-containing protein [Mesorhizobium sp.]TIW49180.1 MAG: O-antigen ligase family protein [Mesorhizobium sp.]